MPKGQGGYNRTVDGRRVDENQVQFTDDVGEVARFVDEANLYQPIVPNLYNALSGTLAVEPSSSSLTLEWGAGIVLTAGGAGVIVLAVAEQFSNGNTKIRGLTSIPGPFAAGLYSSQFFMHGRKPIWPSASWRYFRLWAAIYQESGSSLYGYVAPSGAENTLFTDNSQSPYMRALR